MKVFVGFLFFISTVSAFAGQKILCHQVDGSGRLKAHRGRITLNLEYNKNGDVNYKNSSVKIKGFTNNIQNNPLNAMRIVSISQSKENAKVAFTTLFLAGESNLPLDIQLQFDSRILATNFRSQRAGLVIGSEDANPEVGFSFGFDLVCNGRMD